MPIVASVFKGITINKKMRLDHDLLSSPETRILKYHGYSTLDLQANILNIFGNAETASAVLINLKSLGYNIVSRGSHLILCTYFAELNEID